MLPTLCAVLGKARFTNNSTRPSSIQAMKRGNFSDREIQSISGHRDANSLKHYDPNPTDEVAQRMAESIANSGLETYTQNDAFRRRSNPRRQASATITSYKIPDDDDSTCNALRELDNATEIDNDLDFVPSQRVSVLNNIITKFR